MTLVSIPLMDKTGRRTLHLYGLGGMFIFSIFITISFLIKASKRASDHSFAIIELCWVNLRFIDTFHLNYVQFLLLHTHTFECNYDWKCRLVKNKKIIVFIASRSHFLYFLPMRVSHHHDDVVDESKKSAM